MYKKKLFESPSMRGKTIGAIISTLHEKIKEKRNTLIEFQCYAKIWGML